MRDGLALGKTIVLARLVVETGTQKQRSNR